MEDPPQYSAEESATNVLVVGESQQGKSSFIKRISQYAGMTNIKIGIGNGNLACTKSVNVYTITVTPQSFELVEKDGKPISGLSYNELCTLTDDNAKVVEVEDEEAKRVTFNFIDTPGLNDSDGDDLMNIAHIVGRCSEISHLNALVYVRSVDEPYSRSFQQFFQYLQRCLPTFSNGFVIVHTRFSTGKVQEYLEQEIDLAALRRDAFQKTTNLQLEHFFVENVPDLWSPFEQMQSLNETCRVLQHLHSQKAAPSTVFKLLKTDGMQNIDIFVRNSLNELKIALERERRKEEKVGEAFRDNGSFHQTEISRLKIRISTISSQVQSLINGPDVVLGTKSYVEDYTLGTLFGKAQLYLNEAKVDYVAEHEITTVMTSKKSGSKWKNMITQGNTWSGILAGSAFRGLSGTATFYTTSAIRNREVINVFQTMVKELEDGIVSHEQAVIRNSLGEQYNEHAVQLGMHLGKVEDMLNVLASEEFQMGLWPLLRPFYSNTKPLSKHQIREFVKVYDEDVAELLPH